MPSILYRSAEIRSQRRTCWKIQEQVPLGLIRKTTITTLQVICLQRFKQHDMSVERWLFLWKKSKWEKRKVLRSEKEVRNLKSWILKSQISAKLSRKFYQEPVFTPDDLAFFLKNQGFPERQIPRMKSVMGILGIFSYVKAQFSLMNYQYGTSGFCILVIGSAERACF